MTQRRPWTKQEDQHLKYLKEVLKINKWSEIAQKMTNQFGLPGRNQKQCRQRYHNHLDQNISFKQLTDQQEELLFQSHDQIGNKWSLIAIKFKGRTDNYLKNHFYSKLRSAVRRINRSIKENFKKNSTTFNLNIVYKIVQLSELSCQLHESLSEKQQFFFVLKNQILQFGGAKLAKDYFQFIHQDDQVDYLIERLKKFQKTYALAKSKNVMRCKNQDELQSDHTLCRSSSENEQQCKRLFKTFEWNQQEQIQKNNNTITSLSSYPQLNPKSNSIQSIETEFKLEKLVFPKNNSIIQIEQSLVEEDSDESLMNNLLKDQIIKIPTFIRNNISNYSTDSFHLNQDSFQLNESNNNFQLKRFDSRLSIDSALFE